MSNLGEMTQDLEHIAVACNEICWMDIMHGQLPTALHDMQMAYCTLFG